MGSIDKSRKKIAIIGSGCAGLAAAWALKSTAYNVHIFEKNPRLGGHTNTQPWKTTSGETLPVDTGFIVMNTATYPNFIRFLKNVGVDTVPTQMTFGVSRDSGKFEWSGEAEGIFAQRRNIFRLRHWRLIFDIVRFNQFALDLLLDDEIEGSARPHLSRNSHRYADNLTIGQYLDIEGYSRSFRDDYLIPMTAAVWSTSPDKASLEFPARTLIRFLWNHHLLSTLAARPPWLTIPGGSQKYIDAIVKAFPQGRLHQHLSCSVSSAFKHKGQVTLKWANNKSSQMESMDFDHVIFACHGDEILPILNGGKVESSSSKEPATQSSFAEVKSIFNAFQTTENKCYLHSDLSLMPKRRACWTAWNYLTTTSPSKQSHPAGVSLTYCMNILQHFPEEKYGAILVTMNPPHPPKPSLTQGEYVYRHPLYTNTAIDAQKKLEQIQNKDGLSYCGAWTKYGFHEDGFSSGLKVATKHLGAALPFEFVDSTYSRGHMPTFCWKDYILRIVLILFMLGLRVFESFIQLPVVLQLVAAVEALGSMVLEIVDGSKFLKDPS